MKPEVWCGAISKEALIRERAEWVGLGRVIDWLTRKGLASPRAYPVQPSGGTANAQAGSEFFRRFNLTTLSTSTRFVLCLLPCSLGAQWPLVVEVLSYLFICSKLFLSEPFQ